MGTDTNESRKAYHELLDLLREVDARFLGPEWGLTTPEDVATGLRAVVHMLQGGLYSHFEEDAAHPRFRRIVSPYRKFTGDNADAIYFEAPVDPAHSYRIEGDRAGAVYLSLTVEAGARDGAMGTGTAGVLNDERIDFDADGRFVVTLGGPEQTRNWIGLSPDATRITTRHYFENETAAAADQSLVIPLSIHCLEPTAPPSPPDDTSVAAGIRRVANFVRSRTLEMPKPGETDQPAFVSAVPNRFPPPVKPGNHTLAAADAAYSMAPYLIGPDHALVIRGRWPRCRCANVSLWNRHMQTYDYTTRTVSLNRAQTRLDDDGGFRIVLAHRDPGVPNWIDTEGRPFGLVFWRFMLPEGEIETPSAELVALEDVR